MVKNNRNVDIIEASRHKSKKTVRKRETTIEKECGRNLSTGTIFKLHPFFVTVPAEPEKLECLCQVCLSTRNLFEAVMWASRKNKLKVFASTAAYITDNRNCKTARSGYHANPLA